MSRTGIILLALCLSLTVHAGTKWLIQQPVIRQAPSTISKSHQNCHYRQQLALARQGLAESQYQVALCYYYGLSVEANAQKALHWLQLAAGQKHIKAMYQLAEFHNRQDKYYDPTLAMEWYKKAAKAEYIPAQVRMAEMYVQGVGVPKDYVEAYKWLSLAEMFNANVDPQLRGSIHRQRQSLAQKMTPAQITRAREEIGVLLQDKSTK